MEASMLTQHQLNEFRRILERRFLEVREEIRQELLQSDEQSYIELAGQVPDLENSALADLLVDIALADIDRHVQEIRDINAALLRIAEESYGLCCDCGESIDLARLGAYPTAKRCLSCQSKTESRFARLRSTSL